MPKRRTNDMEEGKKVTGKKEGRGARRREGRKERKKVTGI